MFSRRQWLWIILGLTVFFVVTLVRPSAQNDPEGQQQVRELGTTLETVSPEQLSALSPAQAAVVPGAKPEASVSGERQGAVGLSLDYVPNMLSSLANTKDFDKMVEFRQALEQLQKDPYLLARVQLLREIWRLGMNTSGAGGRELRVQALEQFWKEMDGASPGLTLFSGHEDPSPLAALVFFVDLEESQDNIIAAVELLKRSQTDPRVLERIQSLDPRQAEFQKSQVRVPASNELLEDSRRENP